MKATYISNELPPDVQAVIYAYLGLLENKLPGLLTGLYLHGSVALSAFDPHFSDVDFLTLISRCCTTVDLSTLAEIHQIVAAEYPKTALDGGYLQWDALGRTEDEIATHPYYNDGRLQTDRHNKVNAVTLWLLKNRGVVLLGPNPQEMPFEVSGDRLISYTLSNLNTYWTAFLTQPHRVSWLMYDDGIQWVVLGVLRQYYTLREQQIISKVAAGVDALDYLPTKWHCIVKEAVNIRQRVVPSLYQNKASRATDASHFLRFIITDCNNRYAI